MAVEKLLSIDTTPADKSVVVNVSTGGQPEHAVYSARIENGTLTIINSVTSTKRFSAPFEEVLINGQAYSAEQDCIAALTDIGNFDSSTSGGGGGGDVDPATATPKEDTRLGAVGLSVKYAREDHSHPIANSLYVPLSGNNLINPITGAIYFVGGGGDYGSGSIRAMSNVNTGLLFSTTDCGVTIQPDRMLNLIPKEGVNIAPSIYGGVSIQPVRGDILLWARGTDTSNTLNPITLKAAGNIGLYPGVDQKALYNESEIFTVAGGTITGEVKFDENIELGDGKKILFRETDENGVTSDYAMLFVGEYSNITNPFTGQVYPRWLQVEPGNSHMPLNLNHANNPISGKYIAYDVGAWMLDKANYPALGKQVLATFTEGVLQLPSKFFNPVPNGSGGYVIEGVTLQELNVFAAKYNLGLYPVAIDQSVLTFRVTQLVINDAVAYFDYNFTKVTGDTIERYIVSISGTEQTVATLRCERTVWQIGQLPVPFYVPYGNGTPVDIAILDSGINLLISYKDTQFATVQVYAKNGNVQTNTIYRTSLPRGAAEGGALQNVLVTSTPQNVDESVYSDSSDHSTIRIWITGTVYIVDIIGVGNGFAVGEMRKIHA